MSRLARLFAAALLLAAGALPLAVERPAPPRRLAARVLGPVASLAASVEWVLADRDLSGGHPRRGLARALAALELDPGPAAGWSFLAAHLVHERSSPESEPDPQARLAWVEEALALLERGERESDEPAELAFHAGLLLAFTAMLPDVYPWPGGPETAWRRAAARFERAALLGHPRGEESARLAREAAREGR